MKQLDLLSIIFIAATLILSSTFALGIDSSSKPDKTWVSTSGIVISADKDSFILNNDQGTVTVKMNDWDLNKEGWRVSPKDKVFVRGEVDANFHDNHTIKANSIYIHDQNSFRSVSAMDKSDCNGQQQTAMQPDVGKWLNITVTMPPKSPEGNAS